MDEAQLFEKYLSNFKEIYTIYHAQMCKYYDYPFAFHFANDSFWYEEFEFHDRIYITGFKVEDTKFVNRIPHLSYNNTVLYELDEPSQHHQSFVKRYYKSSYTLLSETDIFYTVCDINMDSHVSSYYC